MSLLHLFFLLLQICSSTPVTQQTSDASRDLHVLLDLRSALSVKPSTRGFDSWTTAGNPPCNFTFVACDSQQYVTSIDFPDTTLTGTLPFRSLCQLPRLSTLSAASNQLHGPLTPDLRNCTSLTYLDVSSNFLTGSVPDLSPLSELRFLNLSHNGFTGPIPSFRNLTNLVKLLVGDIPFKPTPFPVEVLRFRKLNYLYLSNCSLTGEIPPGIGNLTFLQKLELSWNSLTGAIPVEIAKLVRLSGLELYKNSLTGILPVGFGNLTNLRSFDASNNSLRGNLSEIRTLRKLQHLHLYMNDFSGEVPSELGEFPNLVTLSLYNNRFTGELPRNLGNSSEFDVIDVSSNGFTGRIPPGMCRLGRMTMLLILQNRFTGEIPATYGSCRTMTRLRVSDNHLSGDVPGGIWSLPSADIIDLAGNRLSGTIPAGIGKAKALEQLLIAGNEFAGEIPEEIGEAINLVTVDASWNRLSGKMPSKIGELKKLNRLLLRDNRLSGGIPPLLGTCELLTELDLSGNGLSGEIPAEFGQLRVLNSLNLSGNALSGGIPSTLSALKLSYLDLSGNHLRGRVPAALDISTFRRSFLGNPGLCGGKIVGLRPCGSASFATSDHLRAIISSLLGVAAIIIVSVGFLVLLRRRRRHNATAATEWNVKPFRTLSFDEKEIVNGVLHGNLIGRGGSGNVYRVRLRDGSSVAVKHIATSGVEEEGLLMRRRRRMFEAEVGMLSSIKHVGVVKLFCSITAAGGGARLLVYEYLGNGSLWERLHGDGSSLGWKERYDIAVGSARGLEYLHHGCERPILHRDVKSSNILLDDELKPRIADFGLAKILQGGGGASDESSSSCIVAGTHGYIAPEYAYMDRVNEKSDVYSFGVVLLEIATGLKPLEPQFGENKNLVHWVHTKMAASKEGDTTLLDPNIQRDFHEEATKVLKLGALCTVRLPTHRPSMKMIVQMLQDAASWHATTNKIQ